MSRFVNAIVVGAVALIVLAGGIFYFVQTTADNDGRAQDTDDSPTDASPTDDETTDASPTSSPTNTSEPSPTNTSEPSPTNNTTEPSPTDQTTSPSPSPSPTYDSPTPTSNETGGNETIGLGMTAWPPTGPLASAASVSAIALPLTFAGYYLRHLDAPDAIPLITMEGPGGPAE